MDDQPPQDSSPPPQLPNQPNQPPPYAPGQQPGSLQPGFGQGQQPGYPYVPPTYPEESQALAALLVSLLGLVICSGLICPFGWVMANKELAAIAEGRRDPTKKDMATAAKVIGIIGTILVVVGILFIVGFIVLIAIGSAAGA